MNTIPAEIVAQQPAIHQENLLKGIVLALAAVFLYAVMRAAA